VHPLKSQNIKVIEGADSQRNGIDQDGDHVHGGGAAFFKCFLRWFVGVTVHGLGSFWCPLAVKNGGEIVSGVRVDFSGAGCMVRGLSASHAGMVSPEVLQYFTGGHWLAVVGECAKLVCIVGACDHGLGSFNRYHLLHL